MIIISQKDFDEVECNSRKATFKTWYQFWKRWICAENGLDPFILTVVVAWPWQLYYRCDYSRSLVKMRSTFRKRRLPHRFQESGVFNQRVLSFFFFFFFVFWVGRGRGLLSAIYSFQHKAPMNHQTASTAPGNRTLSDIDPKQNTRTVEVFFTVPVMHARPST